MTSVSGRRRGMRVRVVDTQPTVISCQPAAWRRDHARLRQGVEAVHSTWTDQFRLDDERPHTLSGVLARVAAIAALHNACISINRSLGRADLAFAECVGW
jgi:hypothetical protein